VVEIARLNVDSKSLVVASGYQRLAVDVQTSDLHQLAYLKSGGQRLAVDVQTSHLHQSAYSMSGCQWLSDDVHVKTSILQQSSSDILINNLN